VHDNLANIRLQTLVCTQVVVKELEIPRPHGGCVPTFPDAILRVLFMISLAKKKLATRHVEKSKI
jgi:hypothetical protein